VEQIGSALARVLNSERGRWILASYGAAACEYPLCGVVDGAIVSVRMDRTFVDDGVRWIIDYKTAHADDIDPAKALPGLRALFAPQIEAYAKIMRNLHGTEARIFAGLYYPRMLLFDWWKL